ncbi:ArgR family transcriptional regulator [Pediococcus acidilactici]
MKKDVRRDKILDLISEKPISTQLELLQALADAGIKTTQATLSRDIKEMHLVKQADITGALSYRVMDSKEQVEPDNSPIREVFQESVTKITQVQFTNIVKTEPNHGNRVAAVVDDANIEEIRGTLAGFDTLVIFSADVDEATSLNQKLNELMQEQ